MILLSQERSSYSVCWVAASGFGSRCGLRALLMLLGVALAAGSLGCAFGELRPHDPMQREYSLEELQKRYTDLVRFGNFRMASGLVDPAYRKAFMDSMPHEDDMRFLDYETNPFVLNEAMTESTVEVVYTAYSPWQLTQFELYETQEWVREPGIGNHWKVRSSFVGLEEYAKKRAKRPFPSSRAEPATETESN